MTEVKIYTLSDLTREIETLISKTGWRWWFRGHSNANAVLLPSVRRGYSREQERYLSNEFYVRARTRYSNCPSDDDYAGWLALMQHFGLPTRLLDWSGSPLIAAFFAVETYLPHSRERSVTDACIWALAPSELNRFYGFEPLLYPLNARRIRDLIRPALKGWDPNEKQVAAAMAVETDARMQMQQGAFTVHASDEPLDQIADDASWLTKFIISVDALEGMGRELEILGIRRGDLFPDLGNLAIELKGRHQPALPVL